MTGFVLPGKMALERRRGLVVKSLDCGEKVRGSKSDYEI